MQVLISGINLIWFRSLQQAGSRVVRSDGAALGTAARTV